MKTFAQLKRDMSEGTLVETVLNNCRPEKTGQIRKIVKAQSNAIAFEIPENEQRADFFGRTQTMSWLWWDKASCYDYDGDTVKVYHIEKDGTCSLDFIYKILAGGRA